MRSVIYLVEASRIPGTTLEAYWLAMRIRNRVPPSMGLVLQGQDISGSDTVALFDRARRVGVVHFLGPHDDDGKRVRFCVNDLTDDNFLIQAVEEFSRNNGNLLQKIE